jgi:hypothetical protein
MGDTLSCVTERVNALRITIKTREAFPLDNPRSVPLVRLMAALNDTRLMQLRTAVMTNPERQAPNRAEQLVRSGEAGYYGRMFLAHLYEVGQVLHALDEVAAGWVTATAAREQRYKEALERLRNAFSGSKTGGFYGFLGRIRNLAAFHYKDGPFRDALAAAAGETEIVIAHYAGLSRYSIIDTLLDGPVSRAVRETGITVDAAVAQGIRLSSDLEDLMTCLLDEHLAQYSAACRKEAMETLPVPPPLRKAAVARARKRATGQPPTGS